MRLIMTFVSTGDVVGQFIPPPPTCPFDTITFECTVAGDNGVTFWRLDGGSTSCILLHRDTSVTSVCNVFTAMFENTSTNFFPTTLSATASPALNATLVECLGPAFPGTIVGDSTIEIIGKCVSG